MIGADEVAALAELYDCYAHALERLSLQIVCRRAGNSMRGSKCSTNARAAA